MEGKSFYLVETFYRLRSQGDDIVIGTPNVPKVQPSDLEQRKSGTKSHHDYLSVKF